MTKNYSKPLGEEAQCPQAHLMDPGVCCRDVDPVTAANDGGVSDFLSAVRDGLSRHLPADEVEDFMRLARAM